MSATAKIITPPAPLDSQPPPQVLKIARSEDVERAFNRIQYLNSRIASIEEGINSAIATTRANAPSTELLSNEKKLIEDQLFSFAKNNRALFPKDSKTLDFSGGALSFTTGPGAVDLKPNKFIKTMKDVVKAILQKKWKFLLRYNDPEVDKVAVKKRYNAGKIDDKALASVGLKIVREETFTYKLNPSK